MTFFLKIYAYIFKTLYSVWMIQCKTYATLFTQQIAIASMFSIVLMMFSIVFGWFRRTTVEFYKLECQHTVGLGREVTAEAKYLYSTYQ